jgi:hypothetical protein
MEGESFVCLPRNRPALRKMDGGVSVQHEGGGYNGGELKFVVSPQIQAQRTNCSCIRSVLTLWTAAAPPQPPPATNAKDTGLAVLQRLLHTQ